jgi:hypothetical protein
MGTFPTEDGVRVKLYLSGPITGNINYMEDFTKWEKFLIEAGYTVFNPASLGEGLPDWHSYLKRDIPYLIECDGLFAMPGWEGSKGAQLEIDLARRLEIKCLTIKDNEIVELVGRKFDGDKLRWELLPWREVEQVVEILTIGAKKYDDNNWQKVEPFSRYASAAFRHFVAWCKGEPLDQETGKNHLAHAICCLLFLLWKDNNAPNQHR